MSASPTAFSNITGSLKSPGPFNLFVCLKSSLDAAAGAFPSSRDKCVLVHSGVSAPAAPGCPYIFQV